MSYFKNFDRILYQFPDNVQRIITDLSVRPKIRTEVLTNSSNYEFYNIEEGETPDAVAQKRYGDPTLHWAIMLSNDVVNLYTDWPKDFTQFEDYIYEKYKGVVDSDGSSVTLTKSQTITYTQFAGSPINDFTSLLDDTTVRMKPHHFIAENKVEYAYDSIVNNTNSLDAHGNNQSFPTVTPVSIYTYESDLNEEKRNIIIPRKSVIDKIVSEIGDLLNDQS